MSRPVVHLLLGKLEKIPKGSAGLARKIAAIRRLVHRAVRDPKFRDLATSVLRHVTERDWDGEIRAVQRFVQRIRFTRDPYAPGGLEVFTAPEIMIRNVMAGEAFGDCDDHVILASAMYEVLGHPTRYRVGGPGRGQYQHIWIDVRRPTGEWVPVELIRDEVLPGWDPSVLFAHTETHQQELQMSGMTVTVEPRAGGRVSRQLVRQPLTLPRTGGVLPSDMRRALLWRDNLAGITPSEMVDRSNRVEEGLGWIAAVAALATAAGGLYQQYEDRKQAKKRRARELAQYGISTQEIPNVDYAGLIGRGVYSAGSLVSEFYQEPGQLGPGEQGPLPPGAGGPSRAQFMEEFDRMAPMFVQTRGGGMGRGAPASGLVARPGAGHSMETLRSFLPYARTEGLVRDSLTPLAKRYSGYLKFLTPAERQSLISTIQGTRFGNELQLYGLGEDPTDPGPYVPITKPLQMPPEYNQALQSWTGKVPNDMIVPVRAALVRIGAQQQTGSGWMNMKVGEAFDVNDYPRLSGGRGGSDQFARDWGSLQWLSWPAVDFLIFISSLLDKPDPKMAGNWRGQLQWIKKSLLDPITRSWMAAEAARRLTHQKKKDDYDRFVFNKGAAERERIRKEAEAQRARELAERLERERLEERRRQDAMTARQRAQYELSRRRSGGGSTTAPRPGQLGPGEQGPTLPPPAKSSGGGLMFAVGAGALLFMLGKKKRRRR